MTENSRQHQQSYKIVISEEEVSLTTAIMYDLFNNRQRILDKIISPKNGDKVGVSITTAIQYALCN